MKTVAKLTPQINYIRLLDESAFGLESVMHKHLLVGHTLIDGRQVTLAFDPDPRFVRVSAVGRSGYTLVPLSNIGTMHVKEVAPAE